jgi:hypothetical protein
VEAFEQVVAVPMESEGLVVSGGAKFPVKRKTAKKDSDESQSHGYEVDLIGANRERLVVASVNSFFGSRGVQADEVLGRARRLSRSRDASAVTRAEPWASSHAPTDPAQEPYFSYGRHADRAT